MRRDFDPYPRAPTMPAVWPESVEVLLFRLERALQAKAPSIIATMNPGLTRDQLCELEARAGVVLPADLRALYHWRNGASDTGPSAFPGHWFVPLERAVSDVEAVRQQVDAMTPVQREDWSKVAYRQAWFQILDDCAGDGYYWDPARTEQEGSFFYNFHEMGHYIFFPAFRSYLAGLVGAIEAGSVRLGPAGAEVIAFREPDVDRHGVEVNL